MFADARIDSAAEQNRAWEEHKARERAARGGSTPSELADVPLALPALARAAKLGKRAGRVGFDWPDARGVRAKIDEELREIDEVPAATTSRRAEELGDLLFAVANWARHLQVDAGGGAAPRQCEVRTAFPRHGKARGERALVRSKR